MNDKKKLTKNELLKFEKFKADMIRERAKSGIKTFRKEFRKEMNTAILAAFGFLIALVWKDVITGLVDRISQRNELGSATLSALIVTGICVLGIMLFSAILKDKEETKVKNEEKGEI